MTTVLSLISEISGESGEGEVVFGGEVIDHEGVRVRGVVLGRISGKTGEMGFWKGKWGSTEGREHTEIGQVAPLIQR